MILKKLQDNHSSSLNQRSHTLQVIRKTENLNPFVISFVFHTQAVLKKTLSTRVTKSTTGTKQSLFLNAYPFESDSKQM